MSEPTVTVTKATLHNVIKTAYEAGVFSGINITKEIIDNLSKEVPEQVNSDAFAEKYIKILLEKNK